jgi:hypothetical protein
MADQEMIAERAECYVRMEGHDLANMASIAAEAMSGLSKDDAASLDRLSFTVYYLEEMILRFTKRYLERTWSQKDLYPGAPE